VSQYRRIGSSSIKAGSVFASCDCVPLLPDSGTKVETAATFYGNSTKMHKPLSFVRPCLMRDAITQCIH
jgi:hypothetical protein